MLLQLPQALLDRALELGRRFLLVDDNREALEVMARRFAGVAGIRWVGFDPADR